MTDAFLPARVLMSNDDEEDARTGNEAKAVSVRRNRIGKEAYFTFMFFERGVDSTALKPAVDCSSVYTITLFFIFLFFSAPWSSLEQSEEGDVVNLSPRAARPTVNVSEVGHQGETVTMTVRDDDDCGFYALVLSSASPEPPCAHEGEGTFRSHRRPLR